MPAEIANAANVECGRYVQRCPVGCAGPLEPTKIALVEGVLLRCAECGQLVSQCTEEAYRAALEKWDTAAGTLPDSRSEPRHEVVSRRRLATILGLLRKAPSETRLLDVGCSSGAHLRAAAKAGFEVEGVEPSPEAAESARRAGFKVFTGLLEEARYRDGAFDAVTLIELVEHLREPRALLAECRRILRPGGVLMVTTPNAASLTAKVLGADWEVFSLRGMGGHVSFFNPASLRLLAARTGFEVTRIETRHVRLAEKDRSSRPVYVLAKVAAALLDSPSRLARAGHALTAFLRPISPA